MLTPGRMSPATMSWNIRDQRTRAAFFMLGGAQSRLSFSRKNCMKPVLSIMFKHLASNSPPKQESWSYRTREDLRSYRISERQYYTEKPSSWLSGLVSSQAFGHRHLFGGDQGISTSVYSLRPCLFPDPTTKRTSVQSWLQFSGLAELVPSG